jgi:outer membrane immunogenic protein
MTKHTLLASVFVFGLVAAPAHAGWGGLYVGLHGGGAWGDTDVTTVSQVGQNGFWEVLNGASFNVERDGVIGGAQLGYDFAFSKWVVGFELAGSYGDVDQTLFITTDDQFTVSSRWLASASLRAGFVLRPTSLLYVKGGFATGDVETREIDISGGPQGQFATEETHSGWLAGAGWEEAISSDLSFAVEYNYIDLGNQDHASVAFAPVGGTIVNDVDVQQHAVTARLNWHFWSP